MLTAFGLGFAPHVQRKTGTDLRLRAHPVDLLLHRAIAPVAPLHGMRGRGSQRVIKKRQGLFHRGRDELLPRLTSLLEPPEPTPQVVECAQGGLRPTTPSKEGVDLFHQRAQRAQLRQPRVMRHSRLRSLGLR